MDPRSVDWKIILDRDAPRPTIHRAVASSELGALLSALDEMIACGHRDAVLRRAVEIARDRIGLTRVAIYLRDEQQGVMRGTWGTNLEGDTVDERSIAFDVWGGDYEQFERAASEGLPWMVVDNAPLVVHEPAKTRVVKRGWLCCTPIRSGRKLLGVMFNDAGVTNAPVDEARQARAAVLCSLVGTALEVVKQRGNAENPTPRSRAVVRAAQMLAQNPALTGKELGTALGLSSSRVARLFKAEMGMSLVEYKNRLRIERFIALLDERNATLLEVALAAGFGSYAQFHRAFVALRGMTPGQFVRVCHGARNDKPSRQ